MVSTLDILYLVLSICALILTCVLVVLGIETIRTVREIRDISHNVEQITVLVERIAQVVFPGIEKVARNTGDLGSKVASFIKKKSDYFK